MKKTVDEEKKKREDFGSKSSITPIDRQHTKILLALQQANNDLKEAHLVIQSVKVESSDSLAFDERNCCHSGEENLPTFGAEISQSEGSMG